MSDYEEEDLTSAVKVPTPAPAPAPVSSAKAAVVAVTQGAYDALKQHEAAKKAPKKQPAPAPVPVPPKPSQDEDEEDSSEDEEYEEPAKEVEEPEASESEEDDSSSEEEEDEKPSAKESRKKASKKAPKAPKTPKPAAPPVNIPVVKTNPGTAIDTTFGEYHVRFYLKDSTILWTAFDILDAIGLKDGKKGECRTLAARNLVVKAGTKMAQCIEHTKVLDLLKEYASAGRGVNQISLIGHIENVSKNPRSYITTTRAAAAPTPKDTPMTDAPTAAPAPVESQPQENGKKPAKHKPSKKQRGDSGVPRPVEISEENVNLNISMSRMCSLDLVNLAMHIMQQAQEACKRELAGRKRSHSDATNE